jgi:hypothetical protein
MNDKNILFQTIDWSKIPKTEHKGETGVAYWQTLQFDGLRIRIVEYSAGYVFLVLRNRTKESEKG